MTTFNFTTAKLAQLRSYVAENDIEVTGDKRKPESYRKAIAAWIDSNMPTMAELTEAAERIGNFFEEKAAEMQPVAEEAAHATVGIVTAVYEVATSEQAIELYKDVAQATWYGSKFAATRFARFIVWSFRAMMWLADAVNDATDLVVHVIEHPEAVEESAKVAAGLVAYEVACRASQSAEDGLMAFMGWAEGLGADARAWMAQEVCIGWSALNAAVVAANS